MSYKTNYSVYIITNIVTNQNYIGVDTYFPKRLKQHQSLLSSNKHKNKYLQNSFNKYGKENFKFKLLEKCSSREEMLCKEKDSIKYYNSLELGFNHTLGGEGSDGYKHTEESINKMSSWKRKITEEWRNNISKGTKGKKKKQGIKRINHPDYLWLKGENHNNAKILWKDVFNIRFKYLEGIKQRDIAFIYKLSNQQIWNIIHNKIWIDINYNFIKRNNNKITELKQYLYEKISSY